MKISCGTLLYRKQDDKTEVLLIHPSGSYNKHAPWSIPKGEQELGEDEEFTARRETEEEVGLKPPDVLEYLGEVIYKNNKKKVICFAGQVSLNTSAKCNSWEIDQAEFFCIEEAEKIIMDAQIPFIQKLKQKLENM